ncbi:putative non-specific serine/threonine protein kinase [Helianthus anomalus]
MHPSPYKHQYADAYLNGLEVFKLSKDHNLSSPNPKLSLDNLLQSSVIEGNDKTPLYAIIIGVFKHYNTTCDQQSQAQISSDATLPSNRCRRFTLQEVKTATNEFNDNCCIGSGGFDKVYKGYMDNATTTVVVKRLNLSSS